MRDVAWLDEFLAAVRTENVVLRTNGAPHLAEAREAVVDTLLRHYHQAQDQTVSVEEAASLTGVNPETVRRAMRQGEITDLRASSRQQIKVLVRDLALLEGKRRGKRAGGRGLHTPTGRSYTVQGDLTALRRRKKPGG